MTISGVTEMASCIDEDPKNKPQFQFVKLNKAFKLAEQWVNNMSKFSVDKKSESIELEGRTSRLGIGATVPKESRAVRSDNPVERNLLVKLNANKKKAMIRDTDLAARDGNDDEESDEEDSESKTDLLVKRDLGVLIQLNLEKRSLDNRLISC